MDRIIKISVNIHILFKLSENISIAQLVEEIKKESSRQIKTFSTEYNQFNGKEDMLLSL